MKKASLFLSILGMLLLQSACHKNPQSEWERFYGYTKADLLGHYEANPDDSYYEELPTEGVVIYRTAVIDITEYDENLVNIRVTIPNYLNRTFRGAVAINQSEIDSDVHISESDGSDILMTVYRNKKQQVRLHGRTRRPKHWDENGIPDDYYLYGFEVVKTDNLEK